MFNNCNSKTNGEEKIFMDIKDNIHVIFDVGCRTDSGEVHYFDPTDRICVLCCVVLCYNPNRRASIRKNGKKNGKKAFFLDNL
jgi:hypothetical protein